MAAGAHFWRPKFTFDRISGHFRSICNFNFFENLDKMAAVGHFGCPKFTCDRISGHFRSIRIFLFFLEIFDKMAAVGHFECPKFTFYRISGHFRSIRNFNFLEILTKWLPSAILDVRNSLSITFLAILDQYGIFICFWIFLQNGRLRPFWISEMHFWSHFWPFQIDTQHLGGGVNFDKMAAVGHFGCPKFTFDRISGHFRSIRNFFFFEIFYKMAASGHFECSKITFDRISGHFWQFFTKWPPADILNVRKSLLITFLAISDRYSTFFWGEFLTKWLPSAILDVRNSLSIAFLVILDQYGI